jgi:hypothetical protein
LRVVWDETFTKEEYPYQRLSVDGAKKLLANGRSVDVVAEAIKDAPLHAASRINAPLGYVLAALQRQERARQGQGQGQEEGYEITDDIRRLTEMGRRRYAPSEDGG